MTIRRVDYAKYHTYYLDDKKLDGVTTVINKGMPKPALLYWASRVTAEAVAAWEPSEYAQLREKLGQDGLVQFLKATPDRVRDKAAVRGTEVHKYAEALSLDKEVDVPQELAAHVDSALAFLDQWQIRTVLTEVVVASKQWAYAGTFDLLADLPDGRRVLFDYKTGAKGIFAETALQLAAYRHADTYLGTDGTEMPVPELSIDECMAVWVRPDGYDVIPLDTSETVFRAFLHVQHVARTTQTMRSWVKAAVYP